MDKKHIPETELNAENETSNPMPDPTLLRGQQLQQHHQRINKQIMEARQQEAIIKDMITAYTIEAAEIRGAIKENGIKQQEGALYGMV